MADDKLFVSVFGSQRVGEYDARTGAAIDANFITGLGGPAGLAVQGPTPFFPEGLLFVANFGGGTVGQYNATTGEAVNANFIKGLNLPLSKPNFITGLHRPSAIALLGNILFVADARPDKVGEYDSITGDAIKADFISEPARPTAIAVRSPK